MSSKQEKLRRILGALPGIYDETGATAPSCERFCRNVCQSLFPFQQTQCINDCLACQQTSAQPAPPPRRKR